ncbi:ABC transporter ATP-binding protein [Natronococcus sp. A-GB7]|uniref:dipeptide ABC transporter ATP-binding protein n=1 Tax=Natronococcus sp. A-GB7 TaxID=3037649 RepID=UPI00241F3E5B|nr:ABC transporter ATP-binding protein [Natronococcus sp. A-GB7]MDG5821742.1 ABC transporter ATP-binding protein [Natronococcus sp. A-GB7]
MTESLLDVRDLCVQFKGSDGTVRAVDGLSLSVEAGEVVGLVGESGCGKSAAVRAIAGLHGDDAQVEGTVTFDGTNLREAPAERLRQLRATQISTVFQDPAATLTPTRTVGSHLREVLRLADRPAERSLRSVTGFDLGLGRVVGDNVDSDRRDRAAALLDNVGLDGSDFLDRYPHELSGGEAQRVSLALALASDPDLLLADEPTTALDATTQMDVLDLLDDLVSERDLTTLLVSHDLELVGERCDRVVVAYAGRTMEAGPAERVLSTPRHPYTAALLACRLDGADPGETLPTVDGSVPDPTTETAGCPFASRCSHATDDCRSKAPPTMDLGDDGRVSCGERDAIAAPEPASASTGGDATTGIAGGAALDDDTACASRSRTISVDGGELSFAHTGASQSADAGQSPSTDRSLPADGEPLLELEDVSKRYPIDDSWLARLRGTDRYTDAVDDVSLSVGGGETLGIVGESGAGKSTVIDLITGLDTPTSGRIQLAGKPIGALGDRSREQVVSIGRLFQHPRSSLDPRQRVRTAIEEPLVEAGWESTRCEDRIRELLTLVGLDNRHADRRPDQLSGGQCQRVALARALALEPALVVLDEPTAALDVSVRAQVCNLLVGLQTHLDCAFVLVSHDLGVVGHLADQIAVMRDGHVVEAGSAAVVCTDPETAYTRRLLTAASGVPDPNPAPPANYQSLDYE